MRSLTNHSPTILTIVLATSTFMLAAPSYGQTQSSSHPSPTNESLAPPENPVPRENASHLLQVPSTANSPPQMAQTPTENDNGSDSFSIFGFPSNSSTKGWFGQINASLGNLEGSFEAGEQTFGYSLAYDKDATMEDTGYRLSFFNSRSPEGVFIHGGQDVELVHDHTPWVHRLGGEAEISQKVHPDVTLSAGVGYQRVSVRNRAFTDEVQERDEFGNRLTFGENGQDDLLTLNFGLVGESLNKPVFPTSGSKLKVGVEQSIPIGFGDIAFNRITTGYSQYIPMAEKQTLLLNLQGGHVIGDLPPYEGFSLGGRKSVRGYSTGELGTGRTFLQATAEYRFPLFGEVDFPFLREINGATFVDFGTDFDTAETVKGEPADERDKAGTGFGVGVGLRVDSEFGPVMVDLGFADQGDVSLHVSFGERF